VGLLSILQVVCTYDAEWQEKSDGAGERGESSTAVADVPGMTQLLLAGNSNGGDGGGGIGNGGGGGIPFDELLRQGQAAAGEKQVQQQGPPGSKPPAAQPAVCMRRFALLEFTFGA